MQFFKKFTNKDKTPKSSNKLLKHNDLDLEDGSDFGSDDEGILYNIPLQDRFKHKQLAAQNIPGAVTSQLYETLLRDKNLSDDDKEFIYICTKITTRAESIDKR